jgi:hypothetical protein
VILDHLGEVDGQRRGRLETRANAAPPGLEAPRKVGPRVGLSGLARVFADLFEVVTATERPRAV